MSEPEFPYLGRIDGVSCGFPCIKGTGILAEVLVGFVVAGDSVAYVAEQYGLQEAAIIDAMRLVLYARGTNLEGKRALVKVDRVLPLTQRPG